MGRLIRRDRGENGFVLLDVLVTLTIIMIGFAVFISSLAMAARIAAKQSAGVAELIAQRSQHAKERTILFQKK